MKHLISLIIPTYKRSKSLKTLLQSLRVVNSDIFEIIVVSQGQDKFDKLGVKVKLIYLTQPSTAHAMNVGAKQAKGDLLLFLDDDVTACKGLISKHRNNFLDPKIGSTCGRVITDGQMVELNRTDTGRITLLGKVKDGFSSTIRQEVDTVIGCNTCWRKNLYEELGGMDEQFTGNSIRLESDLSLRAKKAGYKILFEPKAVVNHHRAETGGARKSEGRLQWYVDLFSNETYFFLKHRLHILLPIFWLTKSEWAVRCMFGFGREVSFRSIRAPFAGMADGVRKYKTFLHKL